MRKLAKRFELKPTINRRDYYCNDCKEITSIYIGRRKMRSRVAFCAWCGENVSVERHSVPKHGGVTGRRHWSLNELNRLKELLDQPVTWEQIAKEFEGKHGIAAIRRAAWRQGWEKKYSLQGSKNGIVKIHERVKSGHGI